MGAINPVLVITDIPAGSDTGDAVTQTLVGVSKLSILWALGVPETVSYEVTGAEVSKLTPGVAATGTRVVAPSLDGGTKIDARMLSGGTQVDDQLPVTASESGQSIGQVLGTTYTNRKTAQQITIDDAFNGVKGTVFTRSGRVATPNGILPDYEGVAYITIGVAGDNQIETLAFEFVIDGDIATILIDLDSNRDKILDIVQAVAERLGSYVDPQKAQFLIDSGDFGIDGSTSQSITIGHKGTTSHCTFKNFTSPTTAQPILLGSQFQPQTLQMLKIVSPEGGTTNHGMPDGGRLTDVVTVNHNLGNATGNYRSGMPVFSIYGDRNNGGVYFWPGDGALHPFSQAMGVLGLWYDDSLPLIYAATDAGVYQHSPDPADGSLWARLGGMALPVSKVISSYGRVYALVTFPNSGIPHVLMYAGTGTGLPTPPTKLGYDGWVSIWSLSGLTDFGIITTVDSGGTTTVLYALSSSSTGNVIKHVVELPGGATLPPDTLLPLGLGDSVAVGVGMDCVIAYADALNGPFTVRQSVITDIYVRTDGGSASLYRLGTGAATLVSTAGMLDATGNTVQINQIYQHSPGVIEWDGPSGLITIQVKFMAATSSAVFISADGAHWLPTDGQSNLGDFNVQRIASAPPRKQLGTTETPVCGIADDAIYVSRNGTVNWVEALSRNLDCGPAFYAAFLKNTRTYPDNTSTFMLYPDWNMGPYRVERQLDGTGQFAYLVMNPASKAPAGAARCLEFSNISTPSQVAEIPSSQLLLDAGVRALAYTAEPQGVFTINSVFFDTDDPLRSLRPTHKATVDGSVESMIIGVSDDPIVLVTYDNVAVWVLTHQVNFDASVDQSAVTTITKCAYLLLDDRSDPTTVAGDLWNKISRIQLYQGRR